MESDLLVVIDGKTYVCEVKASWSYVTRADLDALVRVALQLRPDIALLAVMEAGDDLATDRTEITANLAAAGVKFELMTYQPGEWDAPYLSG